MSHPTSWLALVRHAESQKNIEDRHGGNGRPLTALGKYQVKALVDQWQSLSFYPDIIIGSPVMQVVESAEQLSEAFQAKLVIDEDLRPLDLGEFAGLSRKEAEEEFPEAARRFDLWRQGLLEIGDLRLPGMENIEAFYLRGAAFLSRLAHDSNHICALVSTRSVLILLANICQGSTLEKGGGYKNIEFGFCETFFCGPFDKNNQLIWSKMLPLKTPLQKRVPAGE